MWFEYEMWYKCVCVFCLFQILHCYEFNVMSDFREVILSFEIQKKKKRKKDDKIQGKNKNRMKINSFMGIMA